MLIALIIAIAVGIIVAANRETVPSASLSFERYSDKSSSGWSNWVQQPSTFRGSNAYLNFAAHSAISVRIPLPPDGRQRKVAVLCETTPPWWNIPALTKIIPHLPRWVLKRMAKDQPIFTPVWADGEFAHPGEP